VSSVFPGKNTIISNRLISLYGSSDSTGAHQGTLKQLKEAHAGFGGVDWEYSEG
jgi:hypothetical protein